MSRYLKRTFPNSIKLESSITRGRTGVAAGVNFPYTSPEWTLKIARSQLCNYHEHRQPLFIFVFFCLFVSLPSNHIYFLSLFNCLCACVFTLLPVLFPLLVCLLVCVCLPSHPYSFLFLFIYFLACLRCYLLVCAPLAELHTSPSPPSTARGFEGGTLLNS